MRLLGHPLMNWTLVKVKKCDNELTALHSHRYLSNNGEYSVITRSLAAIDRRRNDLADPARRRGHTPLQRPAASPDDFVLDSGMRPNVTTREIHATF